MVAIAKVKPVNYTADMVATMREMYGNCGTELTEVAHDARAAVVDELAELFKKEKRSIRSKLVNEKVYIARAKVSSVTNRKPEKKDVMAVELVTAAGDTSAVSELSLNSTSVEKMNKTEIDIITAQFNALHAEIGELTAEIGEYQNAFGELPESEELPESDVEPENAGELTD